MDLHAAANEFFSRSKELLDRMKSSEGSTLTEVELHIIRVQCRLLDGQATTLQREITARRGSPLQVSPQVIIKVLFIDPNNEIRQSWAERLTRYSADYVVLHSADGRSALNRVKSDDIDCVVLELDLPDRTGLSILQTLVHSVSKPQMPVVVLTDSPLESLFPLAMEIGAQSCLRKDRTSTEELDKTIRRAIAVVGP